MIIEEIKNIRSGKSELRKFGITVGIVFLLLAGLFLWFNNEYYTYFLVFSAILILPGLILPILLKPIHKVWMTLALLMGWLMTRIILSVLFYVVVTSIGLIAKIFGKKFLDLKTDKLKTSYWNYTEEKEIVKTRHEKQF